MKLSKIFDKILQNAERGSGYLLFAMMVCIVINATGRTLAGWGIPDDVEILSLAYVGVIFLALAPAQRNREHVRVELLVSRLPPKARRISSVFSSCLELFLFVLLVWQSYVALTVALEAGEDFGIIISVPTAPARVVLLVGLVLMIVQVARDLVSNLKGEG